MADTDKMLPTEEQEQQLPCVADNQLITVASQMLNTESKELLNKIIAETDIQKINDFTELFNINQNKKTLVRMDKSQELLDSLIDLLAKRSSERPDELTHKDILDTIKAVGDVIDKGNKQIAGAYENGPLIQINQQNNEVNVGNDSMTNLNRESRDRVKNAVLSLLQGLNNQAATESSTNTDIIEGEITDD